MTHKRILIISSAEKEEAISYNDTFVKALNEGVGEDVAIEWHNYHDFVIRIDTDSLDIQLVETGESLSVFDFVYFKSFFRYHDQAVTIATYLKHIDKPFVSSELLTYVPLTKLSQLVRLALGSLPIAKTIYMSTDKYVEHYDDIVAELGTPFIFKATDGAGGRDNYLIRSRDQLIDAVAEGQPNHFITQEFIENDSDLRVIVLGREPQMVIKRTRSGDTHLNNTSQGADASLLDVAELSDYDREISLKAAALMGRETAGVDLMYELGTGKPYILEVNASPQIGTGAFTDEKIAMYCKYFENVVK